MRIKPTANTIFRNISKPVELVPGTMLPPNQHIFINLHSMLHDSKHWKDPEVFDPDRFLKYNIDGNGKESIEFDKSSTKAWFAFGSGPRACKHLYVFRFKN